MLLNQTIATVISLIQKSRLDLSTESKMQADLENQFTKAGMVFERHKRLSEKDIPDFWIEGGVVVECKMRNKSRKIDIYKQLKRYAQYPEVNSIILASNVSMGLPPEIDGKPVYAASVSRAWL